MSKVKGKDGVERNIIKMGEEGVKMVQAAKESFKEDSHAPVMNAVTSMARASAWDFAHWGLVLGTLAVVVTAVAVYFLR